MRKTLFISLSSRVVKSIYLFPCTWSRTVHCTTASLHRWRSQRPVWQTTSRVVLRLPINPELAPENQLIFYARHKSLLPSFVLAGTVTVTGRPQGPRVTGMLLPWYFVSLYGNCFVVSINLRFASPFLSWRRCYGFVFTGCTFYNVFWH